MLLRNRSSNLSLAIFGLFFLLFGAWDLETREAFGYFFVAMGSFLILSAVFRQRKTVQRDKRLEKVLRADE
jgi:hypothetical protein